MIFAPTYVNYHDSELFFSITSFNKKKLEDEDDKTYVIRDGDLLLHPSQYRRLYADYGLHDAELENNRVDTESSKSHQSDKPSSQSDQP